MSELDIKITEIVSKLGYAFDNGGSEAHESIISSLNDLTVSLSKLESLQWSNRIEDLVGALKMYIIFHDRRNQFLNPGDQTVNTGRTLLRGVTLGTVACKVLNLVCELLPSKDSYSFFSAFVLKQCPSSYGLMEIFRLQESEPDLRTSPFIAYNTIMEVLMKSVQKAKHTLGFAESKNLKNYPATYTAFSMTMAYALEDILKTLTAVIDGELPRVDCNLVSAVLVQVCESCPFHRMHFGVFKTLVDFVGRQLQQRPARIDRRFVLKLAIVCVNQSNRVSTQDLNILFEPVLFSGKRSVCDSNDGYVSKDVHVSRVVAKSVNYLSYWMTAATIGSESLKTSSELVVLDIDLILCLTKNYFAAFKSDALLCLRSSIHILCVLPCMIPKLEGRHVVLQPHEKEIYDMKINVVCHVLQFMVELAAAVSIYANQNEQVDEEFVTEFINVWDLFFNIAPSLMNMELLNVRKGVADCFAAFGSSLFERIAGPRQKFVIVSVLGWCRDDRNSVRAKGGRCLAHLVGYPLLADDEHFLLDALDVIEESLNGGDLATRGSFAWCLGNFAESLLLYHRGKFPPGFTNNDFGRLCKLCFSCAQDKAKIRYNAHRSLGNLWGWAPDIQEADINVLEQSINVLLKQIGSGNDFKARWNASHAMGMIFQNEKLLLSQPTIVPKVLKQMAKVVFKSENYKERNQCVFTLTSLKQRSLYGSYFFLTWQGLLQALNFPDDLRPTEVTQVEKLQLEVCLGICHLMSLLEVQDVRDLEAVLENSVKILQDIFATREVIPEKIHIIHNAREHIRGLVSSGSLSSNDKNIFAQLLQAISCET